MRVIRRSYDGGTSSATSTLGLLPLPIMMGTQTIALPDILFDDNFLDILLPPAAVNPVIEDLMENSCRNTPGSDVKLRDIFQNPKLTLRLI
jgi:hypothetical protein